MAIYTLCCSIGAWLKELTFILTKIFTKEFIDESSIRIDKADGQNVQKQGFLHIIAHGFTKTSSTNNDLF